ncbi:erythromycin esterase family protein [Aquimarina sp. AU58]|uniref:erythromycin esterase family protein n=1 Tax=Aquimarina sp. AU58 TaxID=1874112 RepID=UPI000D65914B|nr:erythromycin esterase family protein [Aquimarina sp. AU58]
MKSLFLLLLLSSLAAFGQKKLSVFEENKTKTLIGNEIHTYDIPLDKGDFLQLHLKSKNVNIQIVVLSPKKDTVKGFNGTNRKNSLEIVELPIKKNDIYTVKISPLISKWLKDSVRQNFINNINGSYTVEKFKILSKNEHNKLISFRAAQKDSVIGWIKNTSIPLKSVKAETGLTDLSYLKPILKNVQIVGLGETSHGTKEIFQMKHRMLEFLVKEMGFTIFAIEASHVGCRPINDYVLYGKGNSRDALSAQGFWVWNTEEVIDMIEWMRDYNMKVTEGEKVQFIGIDTQTNGLDSAYKNVSAFIKKMDNVQLPNVKVDSLFHNLKTIKDKKDMTSQRQELYVLLSYLVVNKIKALEIASRGEYENTISDVRKIIQGVEAGDRKLRKITSYNIRDEYMAQTVLEVLQKKEQEAKMVLWAHNSHISKNVDSYVNGYKKPLGSVLKKYLGDQKYYAIGFATNQGSFQARNYLLKEKKHGGVNSFKIYPGKEGSLDWYFVQSKKNMFFLDFKQPPKYNSIHSFLNKELIMHTASAAWVSEYSYSPTLKIIPEKAYDGMIFIKETSSAVLTPGGEKEIEKRLKKQ